MRTTVIFLAVLLAGCQQQQGVPQTHVGSSSRASISVVQVEGHHWILFDSTSTMHEYGAVVPVHHPDCPCGKGSK